MANRPPFHNNTSYMSALTYHQHHLAWQQRLFKEQTMTLKKIPMARKEVSPVERPAKRIKTTSPVGLSSTYYSVHHELRGKYTRPPKFNPPTLSGVIPSKEKIEFKRINTASRERTPRAPNSKPRILSSKTKTLRNLKLNILPDPSKRECADRIPNKQLENHSNKGFDRKDYGKYYTEFDRVSHKELDKHKDLDKDSCRSFDKKSNKSFDKKSYKNLDKKSYKSFDKKSYNLFCREPNQIIDKKFNREDRHFSHYKLGKNLVQQSHIEARNDKKFDLQAEKYSEHESSEEEKELDENEGVEDLDDNISARGSVFTSTTRSSHMRYIQYLESLLTEERKKRIQLENELNTS